MRADNYWPEYDCADGDPVCVSFYPPGRMVVCAVFCELKLLTIEASSFSLNGLFLEAYGRTDDPLSVPLGTLGPRRKLNGKNSAIFGKF